MGSSSSTANGGVRPCPRPTTTTSLSTSDYEEYLTRRGRANPPTSQISYGFAPSAPVMATTSSQQGYIFPNTPRIRPADELLSTNRFVPSAPVMNSTSSQQERDDIQRAIQLSLNENRSRSTSQTISSTSTSTSNNTSRLKHFNGNKTINAVGQIKQSFNAPASNGEMLFDCSICMECKENAEVVATKCGHLFHRECVTPWLQQSGTCPSCRVQNQIGSLLKIFISAKTTTSASASNSSIQNSHNKNKSQLRNQQNHKTNPKWFNRTIWISSQNKDLTEQALTSIILQRFNIPSEKVAVRSLKKLNAQGAAPLRYVSFKISVDCENTFNKLMDASKWPAMYRMREFIERNSQNLSGNNNRVR